MRLVLWLCLVLSGSGCFGCGDLPSGRAALPAADDCDPGCDLFERCVRPGSSSTCSITCDYDSDCSSGCCAPVEGGGAPACAFDRASCPDLFPLSGGGGGSGASGGGTGSTQGACAFYSSALNRAVCEPGSSRAGCSGTYLGDGTTCGGFSCASPADPSTCTVPGAGGSGGGSGAGGDCSSAWSCTYDGQASPMCQAGCAYSGTQRSFTCQQVVQLVGSATASSCCAVCR